MRGRRGRNGLKFSLSTFSHFKNYIWNRNSEMGNLRDFYKKREAHWPQSIFIWRHNSKMISSERWPLNLTGFGHVTKTSRKKLCRVSRLTGSIRAQGVFSDIKTWASLSKGISFQSTVCEHHVQLKNLEEKLDLFNWVSFHLVVNNLVMSPGEIHQIASVYIIEFRNFRPGVLVQWSLNFTVTRSILLRWRAFYVIDMVDV